MVCVGPSSSFEWVGSAPVVPAFQSRSEAKTVEGTIKAKGLRIGERVASFSVASYSFGCGSDGTNPNRLSNRIDETVWYSGPQPVAPPSPAATLPPYRLSVEPFSGAHSEADINYGIVPTGAGSTSGISCKIEAIPTVGGARWSAIRDQCQSVRGGRLEPGTYTVRLTMTRQGASPETQTSEVRDYVVAPAPQFAVTSLALEPAELTVFTPITARMKIKNLGAGSLRNVPWVIRKDNNLVGSGTRDVVSPGEEFEVTARLSAYRQGPYNVNGEVDPDNRLNEAPSRRGDNRRSVTRQVGPAATTDVTVALPVIVGDPVRYDGPRFRINISVCGLVVDGSTSYRFEVCNDGPQCHPPGLSRHLLAYSFSTFGDLTSQDFTFHEDEANASPRCPASTVRRKALSFQLSGNRPACGNAITHWLWLRGDRSGRVIRSERFSFTVDPVASRCFP
jgi:hypothetical protein